MVVVEFNIPTVVFFLDLVDVVVGEVSGHIVSDLHGNKFGRDAAVDVGVVAVDFLPFKTQIEINVGVVGEFDFILIAVAFHFADAGLWEISVNEGVDFGIIGAISAAVAATAIATAVDYIEVVVKLDFRSILHLYFPAKALFLDFLNGLTREVCGHISGDLLRHNACGYAGVDGRMFAVRFHPLKRVREFQMSTVLEFHLVVMLRLIAV